MILNSHAFTLNWLMVLVLACAAMLLIGAILFWLDDTMRTARYKRNGLRRDRRQYQQEIREAVKFSIENDNLDAEWHLHSLLYEYRHLP